MTRSKELLLFLARGNYQFLTRLQQLGMAYGIDIWTETIQERLKHPQQCVLIQETAINEV